MKRTAHALGHSIPMPCGRAAWSATFSGKKSAGKVEAAGSFARLQGRDTAHRPEGGKATRFADARASGNLWGIFPGFTAKVRRRLRQRLAGLAI